MINFRCLRWFSPHKEKLFGKAERSPTEVLQLRLPAWIGRSLNDTIAMGSMTLNQSLKYWLVVWNMAFIFPYIGNNNPNWLSYFSEGLKPPTRICWNSFQFPVKLPEQQVLLPMLRDSKQRMDLSICLYLLILSVKTCGWVVMSNVQSSKAGISGYPRSLCLIWVQEILILSYPVMIFFI